MIRWLLIIFLALLLINGLHAWLERIGLGRLPGDLRFRLFGREFFLPVASTVVLSLIAALVARFVKL
ncbi:DUF2905 domain-containing protein [Comamonas sp. w2-DMI]|uniref:DUF2905 domain-containing protein n=1 Tax=Comamonas terrae TaxID=673548 RepID=A0ABW5UMC4_9BURK|nr:DUF2905 domain-containing protein [Comamonas terrae]